MSIKPFTPISIWEIVGHAVNSSGSLRPETRDRVIGMISTLRQGVSWNTDGTSAFVGLIVEAILEKTNQKLQEMWLQFMTTETLDNANAELLERACAHLGDLAVQKAKST